jgi:7-cyano-7-deazaguanine synthase
VRLTATRRTAHGTEIRLLSFDYGQAHHTELDFARMTARDLGLRHEVIDLRSV